MINLVLSGILALPIKDVIIPDGTYYTHNLVVPKDTNLIGQGSVVFDGSRTIKKWYGKGNLRWAPYKALPVLNGHGINFKGNQNLRRPVGKYPDQLWIGNKPLRQVMRLSSVTSKTFAVRNGKIWIHKDNRFKIIKVSQDRVWGTVYGSVSNITIKNYSPSPYDGAAVRLMGGKLNNVKVLNSSFASILVRGSGSYIKNSYIHASGWMGIAAVLCSNFTLENTKISKVNYFGEFSTTPQSGALKTSRCRNIKVLNSSVDGVRGHGLWFDQSTVDTLIENTKVTNISDRALFYEISHGLITKNSYMQSKKNSKFANASGVRLYTTRFIPGFITPADPRNCPDPATPLCAGALKSDRVSPYDPRLTWKNDVKVYN